MNFNIRFGPFFSLGSFRKFEAELHVLFLLYNAPKSHQKMKNGLWNQCDSGIGKANFPRDLTLISVQDFLGRYEISWRIASSRWGQNELENQFLTSLIFFPF